MSASSSSSSSVSSSTLRTYSLPASAGAPLQTPLRVKISVPSSERSRLRGYDVALFAMPGETTPPLLPNARPWVFIVPAMAASGDGGGSGADDNAGGDKNNNPAAAMEEVVAAGMEVDEHDSGLGARSGEGLSVSPGKKNTTTSTNLGGKSESKKNKKDGAGGEVVEAPEETAGEALKLLSGSSVVVQKKDRGEGDLVRWKRVADRVGKNFPSTSHQNQAELRVVVLVLPSEEALDRCRALLPSVADSLILMSLPDQFEFFAENGGSVEDFLGYARTVVQVVASAWKMNYVWLIDENVADVFSSKTMSACSFEKAMQVVEEKSILPSKTNKSPMSMEMVTLLGILEDDQEGLRPDDSATYLRFMLLNIQCTIPQDIYILDGKTLFYRSKDKSFTCLKAKEFVYRLLEVEKPSLLSWISAQQASGSSSLSLSRTLALKPNLVDEDQQWVSSFLKKTEHLWNEDSSAISTKQELLFEFVEAPRTVRACGLVVDLLAELSSPDARPDEETNTRKIFIFRKIDIRGFTSALSKNKFKEISEIIDPVYAAYELGGKSTSASSSSKQFDSYPESQAEHKSESKSDTPFERKKRARASRNSPTTPAKHKDSSPPPPSSKKRKSVARADSEDDDEEEEETHENNHSPPPSTSRRGRKPAPKLESDGIKSDPKTLIAELDSATEARDVPRAVKTSAHMLKRVLVEAEDSFLIKLVEAGACMSVLKCLTELGSESVDVQEKCMELISSISFCDIGCTELMKTNADATVPQVMLSNRTLPAIQEYGCSTLANIATTDDENRWRLAMTKGPGAIDAVIQAMDNCPPDRDADVFRSGLQALTNLAFGAEKRKIKEEMVKKGVIEAIIRSIKKRGKDDSVKVQALIAFGNIEENDPDMQSLLIEKGAAEVILQTMENALSKVRLQKVGTGVISDLCGNEDCRPALVKLDVCGTFHRVMEAMLNTPSVQQNGCRAILSLALDDNSEATLCEKKCDDSVLDAMRHFPGDLEVQTMACSAITNLAFQSLEVKISLAKKGAIGLIARGMSGFSKNAEVQSKALGALWSLLESEEVLSSSFPGNNKSPDIIKAILNALETHKNNEDVAKEGCGALQCLAGLEILQDKLIERDALVQIKRSLITFPHNADIQEQGFAFLAKMAATHLDDLLQNDEPFAELVMQTIRTNLEEAGVQKECYKFLGRLLDSSLSYFGKEANRITILEQVRTTMDHLSAKQPLQREALLVLEKLSRLEGEKATEIKSPVLSSLVKVMTLFKKDPVIQEHGCRTLFAVSKGRSEETLELLSKVGAMDAVQEAKKHHAQNKKIQSLTKGILEGATVEDTNVEPTKSALTNSDPDQKNGETS